MFPFGHGLSYTNFSVKAVTCDQHHASISKEQVSSLSLATMSGLDEENARHSEVIATVCLQVVNTGSRQGRYVFLGFLAPPLDSQVPGRPLKSLRAFGGVDLAPEAVAVAEMAITSDDLSLADEDGNFHVVKGEWTLISTPDNDLNVSIIV